MRYRKLVAVSATVVIASGALAFGAGRSGQPGAGAGTWTAPKTPWGAPDISGIWNSKSLTPLERPQKFADREFLTDEEITAIERGNVQQKGRDVRAKTGTQADVEGAYNQIFATAVDARYGRNKRSSLIVDPPNGKLPPMTPEGRKRIETIRRGAARSPEAAEAALAAFGGGLKSTPYHVDVDLQPAQYRGRGEGLSARRQPGRPAGPGTLFGTDLGSLHRRQLRNHADRAGSGLDHDLHRAGAWWWRVSRHPLGRPETSTVQHS